MSSDLSAVLLLAVAAAVNPSLFAVTTVMLLLPNPRRAMFGFLCGALLVSITVGLLLAFSFSGGTGTSSADHKVGPAEDLLVGAIALFVAIVLATGRDEPFVERRREKKEAKLTAKREAGEPTESRTVRLLRKGSPRLTFVVGGLLSFPGALYLEAIHHIRLLDPGTAATVALVVFFCVMQRVVLEVPLLGYAVWPDRMEDGEARFRAWLARRGRRTAAICAGVVGAWLVLRGLITLLS
ncbi:MAG TPA: GAP family protein [Acidimicrobiales bacterium]|nr:GAP family protein [Acidimicrobiales bacterium]